MACNFAGALERLGNDVTLFREYIDFYEDDYPPLLRALREYLRRGDAAGVFRAAHALKGLVAHLGADDAVAAAAVLEELGRRKDLTAAQEALVALEAEIEMVNIELNAAKAGQGLN